MAEAADSTWSMDVYAAAQCEDDTVGLRGAGRPSGHPGVLTGLVRDDRRKVESLSIDSLSPDNIDSVFSLFPLTPLTILPRKIQNHRRHTFCSISIY